MLYVVTDDFQLKRFSTIKDFIDEFSQKVPTSNGIGLRFEFENEELYHWFGGRRIKISQAGKFNQEQQEQFFYEQAQKNEHIVLFAESKQEMINNLLELSENNSEMEDICKKLVSHLM